MLIVNDNLLINEAYIVKAEFSKNDAGQVLILLLAAGTSNCEQASCELVLEGREAWALWEYLVGKAERC
ncbi:MAG TPA: hypothetical protein VJ302_22845 [Blastocatellia bacterium]|nr:hypothetical protein [Blastocatellia bacterium]